MFNLLISGDEEAWEGNAFFLDKSRCVREYTGDEIAAKYGSLSADAVADLSKFPSIFAYEIPSEKPPKFGFIRNVSVRRSNVRIEYDIVSLDTFLTSQDLESMSDALDIERWESRRTHWAVKDGDLIAILSEQGITVPVRFNPAAFIDITRHEFQVAFSFPGESRQVVKSIADDVQERLGRHSCFYDNNYVSQLARPDLDILLQDIYSNRSKLIVVFLSSDYQRKEWCGIEFRSVREIIMKKNLTRVMYIRLDDGPVDGVFQTDGYVDARQYNVEQIATFIAERVSLQC